MLKNEIFYDLFSFINTTMIFNFVPNQIIIFVYRQKASKERNCFHKQTMTIFELQNLIKSI